MLTCRFVGMKARRAEEMLVKILALQVTPGNFRRLADMGVSMLASFGPPLEQTEEDFDEAEVRAEPYDTKEDGKDDKVEEEASSDENVELSLPDSGTLTSLLSSVGIGQDEDQSLFCIGENGERMHLQQVSNIVVNAKGVDNMHSYDRRRQVQVKAPVVAQYMSKLKGQNVVGPMDVFASLTNYSRLALLAFGFKVWSMCRKKDVSFSQAEVENPHTNCSVLC